MRIGIDGGCLANRRGFGRYARQIVQALAESGSPHEFVVFVDGPSSATVALPHGIERVVVPVGEAPSQAASSTGRRSFRDLLAMGRAASRERLDLIFFPASYSFFPVWGVGRVVVTMHDTLALAHPELVFPTRAGRYAWALKEHVAVRRADRIVTTSQWARRALTDWFRLPADRVRAVGAAPEAVFGPRPEGPASDAALARYGVAPSAPYFLYVGGLSPNKNLPRLVEGFARSGLGGEGYRLVLVGDTGDVFHTHVPEIRAAIDRHGLAGSVDFTGFVPDEDLAYFYSRAVALVQPSLMEGFGLPPVEAMACGTAVLSSTAGSLPEVVGEGGLFFDPADPGGIAGALRTVADQPWRRLELRAKAARRAAQHTWAATARATLDCFEELGPPRRRAPAPARRRSA